MNNMEEITKVERVQKHDFKRVDFSDPTTILTYGEDIASRMSEIYKKSAEIGLGEEVSNEYIDSKILALNGLQKRLDAIEFAKENPKSGLPALIDTVKEKVPFFKKEIPEEVTYTSAMREQTQNSEELRAVMSKKLDEVKRIFDLTTMAIKEFKPFLEIFEEAIYFGELDKKEFEKYVLKKEEEYENDPENIDLRNESQFARNALEAFNAKIFELQKGMVDIGNRISSLTGTQFSRMSELNVLKQFISFDSYMIQIAGQNDVNTKLQKADWKTLNLLSDTANSIKLQSAADQRTNIELSEKMSKDGFVSVETLKKEGELIQQNLEKMKQAEKNVREYQKETQAVLREIYTTTIGNLEEAETLLNTAVDSTVKPKTRGSRAK